ncbi:hypothetical protein M0R45_038211 [Rubus argutus]|uniref:Uncharacterized protein n=1 Tax=Rubus argutus TaxID=59490 RepID=A0AAW1W2N1_RUBAR
MASPSFEEPQQSRESQQPPPHQSELHVFRITAKATDAYGGSGSGRRGNRGVEAGGVGFGGSSLGLLRRVQWRTTTREGDLTKVEEVCSSAAVQIGRYIVTMMSTGVILTIGFQLSGGDSQLNALVCGSRRGLGKALSREFLLSGDRVVVASWSLESVQATVSELEENLKEGIANAGSLSRKNRAHAKVVGRV